MHRCTPAPVLLPALASDLVSPTAIPPRRRWLAALGLWALAAPALAQMSSFPGNRRLFPDATLRGRLRIDQPGQALVNGERRLHLAPGFRLFSPQNTLVMPHTVLGQTFTVNYLIEPSTGYLLTAWVLTADETAQPGKGDPGERNFQFASEQPPTVNGPGPSNTP